MRKVLLFIVILITANHLKSQVLNVSEVIQEQSEWCWAGVSACILDYYCTPTEQCVIAEYTRTVATWHNYGSTNCCVNPLLGCNYWNYNWGYAGSIKDILIHFANISNNGVGSSLTQAQITSDIQNNRAFVIRWGWSTGGGHFIVGHGLVGNNLYYMDPWFGEGLKIADYNWVVSGNNHTWTHTNRLSVTPPVNIPGNAGAITGMTTVCQGQNSVLYNVPPISYASSYIWTLPDGATGTSTTNSITVNFGTSAASGNITVMGTNLCGNGEASSLAVTVNPLPAAAGTISGDATVCQGQDSVIYSVPAIVNALSYVWTLPDGTTGTSTTDSIAVNFGISATSGSITVMGTNSCGNGEVSILPVTVNPLPAAAGIISGDATVCQGQDSVTYSVPAIANALSYIWTLPDGATGTSATDSISVNFGTSAASGNITVIGTNSCGNGEVSTLPVTVNLLPAAAGAISGDTIVCQGQNSVTYYIPPITNASSYVWTLPGGATGTSTTNNITVNFGTSAASGNITVMGKNTCGNGEVSSLAVSVNPLPAAAGTISGDATVCQGQDSVIYSVPAIVNALSYVWTLPDGTTGTSTTDSIAVNFGISATSGSITVMGTNSCGNGEVSILPVTVNPLPAAAGIISGDATVCQGQNSVTYSVPAIANALSYIWTLPDGATGTSATNSITVNFGISATSGIITAMGTNSCGYGDSSIIAITVNSKPNTPIITLNGLVLQSDAPAGNQWYNQDGLIIGATNQSYTVTYDGDYYVIVTLSGCSSDPSNTMYVNVQGIEYIGSGRVFKVYPNPVSNELIIEIIGNTDQIYFEIFNAFGQVVIKGNFVERISVQTSDYKPGIYLIKLDNGNSINFIKAIKE